MLRIVKLRGAAMVDVERINFLARKAKSEGLTPEEREEQKRLREAYIAGFRQSLQSQLDNTVVLRPDGTARRLKRKNPSAKGSGQSPDSLRKDDPE